MTISDVRGHGPAKRTHGDLTGGVNTPWICFRRSRSKLVIPDNLVDAAIDAILLQSASTGKIGDGKIFVSKVDQAIRIRNQERGVAAL